MPRPYQTSLLAPIEDEINRSEEEARATRAADVAAALSLDWKYSRRRQGEIFGPLFGEAQPELFAQE